MRELALAFASGSSHSNTLTDSSWLCTHSDILVLDCAPSDSVVSGTSLQMKKVARNVNPLPQSYRYLS